jgi:hypothetical protein
MQVKLLSNNSRPLILKTGQRRITVEKLHRDYFQKLNRLWCSARPFTLTNSAFFHHRIHLLKSSFQVFDRIVNGFSSILRMF